ncbi:MAG: 1-phosphofructokinase family hexose kinase [Bauldia sp.]
MSIVTLSLNPTIDMAGEADLVRPTHKIRTFAETYDPGGGGVNVARAITELGGEARVVCTAGGFTGAMLDELLGAVPIPRTIVPIAGRTRISLTVFERRSGHEFRFVPSGPEISTGEVEACLQAVRGLEFKYLVASGSPPRGAADDIFARFADIAAAKNARFILDCSGPGLGVTLERGKVYLVKPSFGELESLVGRRLDDEGVRQAASDLVKRGRAEVVVVTMGAAGALLVTKDSVRRMWSPKVRSRSAVGAGDSFLGAMTLALSQGRDVDDALIFAIAAGAAAALTPGTKLCRRDDVARMYDELCKSHGGRRLAV